MCISSTMIFSCCISLQMCVLLCMMQILNSDVDIWCLQEVFFADVHRKIYNAVSSRYPYALSSSSLSANEPLGDSPSACSPEMLQSVGACVQRALQTNCAKVPEKDRGGCTIQR